MAEVSRPRSRNPRTVPLQVLSLGLPRTGTKSMQEALLKLGFKHTYHGFDMIDHPEHMPRWEEATDAKYFNKGKPYAREDWDDLLGHCAATTDSPCALFWEELLESYPEAKVILVQRDIEKWYASFDDGVISSTWGPGTDIIINYIEPALGVNIGRTCRKMLLGFFGASNPDEIRRKAREVYVQHYRKVRAAVPKERLLEYQLGSGWGPLCEFLGKDEPEEEFPWVNEAAALKEKIDAIKKEKFLAGAKMIAPVLAVTVAAFICWYRG
ncbi:hypothetical protein H2201_003842 [Coniosporium apollinis]|uniref:P-loop containing nucleoside triphosphate hydrolase protein n=1 Tax=Coniosporium apollinis TaxID=61459 RepID=A0ABQ9NW33_9PEZI|nr:hypothetical protein H2201_003842 [Coniosporium apollinis]